MRRVAALERALAPAAAARGCAAAPAAGGGGAVCLIVGVGRGTASGVAKRFARGGMTIALARRSPAEDMQWLVDEIAREGGKAVPFGGVDATKAEDVAALIDRVEKQVGPIRCCVYNIGAQVGNRPVHTISARLYEQCWRMGSLGAFLVSKEATSRMLQPGRGGGTVIFTGATAGFRGNSGQSAHAMAMAGRRMLAQSLAHELGPKGIHVAHVMLDGMIDSPDTLGKFFEKFNMGGKGVTFEQVANQKKANESILLPEHIGEAYWFLHTQPKSCWTFEMDLRPHTDKAWYHN